MTPLCKWPIDHLIFLVILGRGILGARGFFFLLLAAKLSGEVTIG